MNQSWFCQRQHLLFHCFNEKKHRAALCSVVINATIFLLSFYGSNAILVLLQDEKPEVLPTIGFILQF
jgi:hypothetical protein